MTTQTPRKKAMRLKASSVWFPPFDSEQLVLPVCPVVDPARQKPLPRGGMNLLTGVSAARIMGDVYRRYTASRERRHYAYYTCYLQLQVPNAPPSSEMFDLVHLDQKTPLLVLETTRTTTPLAEKMHADFFNLLEQKYQIEDQALKGLAPRSFSFIGEHPYVLTDLLQLPDYASLKIVIFNLPSDGKTPRHRYLYCLDFSLVTDVIVSGDDPTKPWRWPTQAERDDPPALYNPYLD